MDTTKKIKLFTLLYVALLAFGLPFSYFVEQFLPIDIRQYLDADYNRPNTINEDILMVFLIPSAVAHLLSIGAILFEHRWAKPMFTYSLLVIYLLGPFGGPMIYHASADTISGAATIVSGVILALLWFTSSAFNKKGLGTALQPPQP